MGRLTHPPTRLRGGGRQWWSGLRRCRKSNGMRIFDVDCYHIIGEKDVWKEMQEMITRDAGEDADRGCY